MSQAFLRAQSETLQLNGLKAGTRFLEISSLGGRAQVITIGDGSPVLLVNGIGTPAAMWAPLMAQLEGFTLHAVDLPGFGLTDFKQWREGEYRKYAVNFLGDVLDGLQIEALPLVTNSLASLWATWFALDRPDRVLAMAHIGCPATVLHTSAPLPMRLLSVPVLGRLMMKLQPPSQSQVKQLSKMVNEDPMPPEIADLLLATEKLPDFEDTFLSTLHTLIRLRGARPEMALVSDLLKRVTQPNLLVFGEKDPMGGPEVGARVAASLPDAELHVVPGGHTPWLDCPEEIGALITLFLRRLQHG